MVSLFEASTAVLQRAPAGAPSASTPVPAASGQAGTQGDKALTDAVIEVLGQLDEWLPPKLPAGLSKQESEIVWDFWTATTGETARSGFKQAQAGTAVRLEALRRGFTALEPVLHRYQQSTPFEAATAVPEFYGRYNQAYHWLLELEAREKASPTREDVAALSPHVRADVNRAITSAVKLDDLFDVLSDVADARGAVYEEELEEAIKQAEENKFIARGTGAAGIFTHLGGICDGIVAILEAKDLEERRQRLSQAGGMEAAEGTIDAIHWATEALRGLTSAAALGTAAIAKLQGMTEEAATCLALSSQVVEGIGALTSALEVVHGILVIANAKTDEEKVEGGVEATAGGLGLAATLGWIPTGVAAGGAVGLKATWAFSKYTFQEVGKANQGIIIGSVNISFRAIQEAGDLLAGKFIYYQNLSNLLRETADPARVHAYSDVYQSAKADVNEQLGQAWTIVMQDEHRAIVNHFTPLIPVVTDKGVEQFPNRAVPKLLDSMADLFEHQVPIYQDAFKEWDEKQSGHHL